MPPDSAVLPDTAAPPDSAVPVDAAAADAALEDGAGVEDAAVTEDASAEDGGAQGSLSIEQFCLGLVNALCAQRGRCCDSNDLTVLGYLSDPGCGDPPQLPHYATCVNWCTEHENFSTNRHFDGVAASSCVAAYDTLLSEGCRFGLIQNQTDSDRRSGADRGPRRGPPIRGKEVTGARRIDLDCSQFDFV